MFAPRKRRLNADSRFNAFLSRVRYITRAADRRNAYIIAMHPVTMSRAFAVGHISGHIPAGTYVIRQHGPVRDAGEKIMADAGALRGPAVAGHAGAVVEHVANVQLHVAVHPREIRASRELGDRSTRSVLTSLSLSFSPLTLLRMECDEYERERKIAVDLNERTWNSKAARTNRRSLCSKLCETAPDDSYRGGIPRARVRQVVRTRGESRDLAELG